MSTRNIAQLIVLALGSLLLALPATATELEQTSPFLEMVQMGDNTEDDGLYGNEEDLENGGGNGHGGGCHDYDNDGICSNDDDDDDGDGILDVDDGCRRDAEDFDGCRDNDGCPETAAGVDPASIADVGLRQCVIDASMNQGASGDEALCDDELANLTELFCAGDQYTIGNDLTGIAAAVPNVTLVDFDSQSIQDPSALAGLAFLEEAILSRNAISNDSTLVALVENDVSLDVSGNDLTDVQALSAALQTGSGVYVDLRCNGLSHAAAGGPGGDPGSDLADLQAVHDAVGTGDGHQNSPHYTARGDRTDCLGALAPGACSLPQVGSTSSDNGYCD